MKLPRYIFGFGPNGEFVTNSKEDFYRYVIAFGIYHLSFALRINGKLIDKTTFEQKIIPAIERFFFRQHVC
jgi:hypothetical protein